MVALVSYTVDLCTLSPLIFLGQVAQCMQTKKEMTIVPKCHTRSLSMASTLSRKMFA
jgi:hypothetical protein